MKKVLSIALATMMLVSIFAVNASAMMSSTSPFLHEQELQMQRK